MKILRSYILKETLKAFALAMLILTFVLMVGNIVKIADSIINKGVQLIYVLKLFLFLMPYMLSYTIPMAILTATLLVFGRLSSDNEIVAMKASGISLFKIAFPVLMLGLLLSLASFHINDKLVPKARFATRKTIRDIGIRRPTAFLEAGTFIKDFKGYIIFIYEIKGNKFKNIRIYQPREEKSTRTIVANEGEFIPIPEKNMLKLKLINGTTEEPIPNDPLNFYKLDFKTYYMTLNVEEPKKTSKNLKKKTKDMTFSELRKEIKDMQAKGIRDITPILIRINRKIAMAFSSLAFILIGLPLAVKTKRSEKSIGFGISLAILMVYWLILASGNILAIKKVLDPWFAMWLPNIIFIILGVFLLHKVGKR